MANIGRAFESFATTAAFAFPSPWGVLGSGVLSVVFMLTGSQEKQENPMVQALEATVVRIKKIIQTERLQQRMHDSALSVREELDWITEKWEILKELDDDRNAGSSFVQDLLTKLNNVDMPDNPVRRAIDDMSEIVNDDEAELGIRDSAFEVMLSAASTFLTYLRLRVQLKSWQQLESGDDLFYAWYDEFVRKTRSEVEKVENALNLMTSATYVDLTNEGVAAEKQDDMVDAKYEAVTSGVAKWNENADSWSENKPPRVPAHAPAVSRKPEEWAAAAPQGEKWVHGAKVRYAVAFKNSKGGTPIGPWSDWVTVADRAFPLVTDIPTDSLKIARSRALHRQFDGQKESLVGIIPDNSTTTYQDSNV